MKDKDKIIEILHSELFIVDGKAEDIADRIIAIQEEEAKKRYEKAYTKYLNDLLNRESVESLLRIASGHDPIEIKPTK